MGFIQAAARTGTFLLLCLRAVPVHGWPHLFVHPACGRQGCFPSGHCEQCCHEVLLSFNGWDQYCVMSGLSSLTQPLMSPLGGRRCSSQGPWHQGFSRNQQRVAFPLRRLLPLPERQIPPVFPQLWFPDQLIDMKSTLRWLLQASQKLHRDPVTILSTNPLLAAEQRGQRMSVGEHRSGPGCAASSPPAPEAGVNLPRLRELKRLVSNAQLRRGQASLSPHVTHCPRGAILCSCSSS